MGTWMGTGTGTWTGTGTVHAEHLWPTAGRRIEKLVMNKQDTAFLLLIGASQRGGRGGALIPGNTSGSPDSRRLVDDRAQLHGAPGPRSGYCPGHVGALAAVPPAS